mmetsp:Transcript_6869/g.41888  ORF Transcript_6869/g.41888 Transcript_6869/m.41888 type:complete len:351 (+) Transcript_6869:1379-2431(+)
MYTSFPSSSCSRCRPFRHPSQKEFQFFLKGNGFRSDPSTTAFRTHRRPVVARDDVRRTTHGDDSDATCMEGVCLAFQSASECTGGVYVHGRVRAGQRRARGRAQARMDHARHLGSSLRGQCNQPAHGSHARCTHDPHQDPASAVGTPSKTSRGGFRVGLWWTWSGHLALANQRPRCWIGSWNHRFVHTSIHTHEATTSHKHLDRSCGGCTATTHRLGGGSGTAGPGCWCVGLGPLLLADPTLHGVGVVVQRRLRAWRLSDGFPGRRFREENCGHCHEKCPLHGTTWFSGRFHRGSNQPICVRVCGYECSLWACGFKHVQKSFVAASEETLSCQSHTSTSIHGSFDASPTT